MILHNYNAREILRSNRLNHRRNKITSFVISNRSEIANTSRKILQRDDLQIEHKTTQRNEENSHLPSPKRLMATESKRERERDSKKLFSSGGNEKREVSERREKVRGYLYGEDERLVDSLSLSLLAGILF